MLTLAALRVYSARPFARLAQLDRASASGAEGHRFESCAAYHFPSIIEKTFAVFGAPHRLLYLSRFQLARGNAFETGVWLLST